MQIEMLEVFSGRGAVTEVFRDAGKACVQIDKIYSDSNSMDFLSPGGFAQRAEFQDCVHAYACIRVCMFNCTYLRLTMACVMREGPNAFNLLAPTCSSWCLCSRGTTLRSAVNPLGRSSLGFVQEANLCMARPGSPN